MWILMVEVCVALGLLVFLVWWTMFQGRGNSKRQRKDDDKR
jgi:hypothetical protein